MKKLIYQKGGFARIEEKQVPRGSVQPSQGKGYTSDVKCPPPSGQYSGRQTQKPYSQSMSYREAVPQLGGRSRSPGRPDQTNPQKAQTQPASYAAQGSSQPTRYTVSKHSDSSSFQTWKYLRNFALGCLAFFLAINFLYVGAVLVAGNPAKLGFAFSEFYGAFYQGFTHGWDSKCVDWYTCEK
jgi:hypothetical protein